MSTPEQRRRSRRRSPYHHGDLRRALVETALELVRRRGPEAFTLREAARRVGVSQTAPYRHFENKEALLAAVAERGFDDLRRTLAEAADKAGSDPRLRLRAEGLASFQFYVADPARFRLMFGRASSRKERYPALAAARQRVNALLVESLTAAQQAGEIRGGDPLELGLAIAAAVHGLAALMIDGQLGPSRDPVAAAELYDRVRTVLYRGLHP